MSIFETTDKLDKTKLAEIEKMFFKDNPVQINPEIEGYRIADNGDFILGCMAGPSCNIGNLLHEMSHLAEREIPKLVKRPYDSWGYSFGKYWEILGRFGYESNTDQSVRREGRIWAYQYSLHLHFDVPTDEDYEEEGVERLSTISLVNSAIYLEAFYIYKNKCDPQKTLEYTEREIFAIECLSKEVKQMSDTDFSFDRFVENWNLRMTALKDSKEAYIRGDYEERHAG